MQVETHERGNGTSVAEHSLDQPLPWRRSAVTNEAKGRSRKERLLVPGGHRQ